MMTKKQYYSKDLVKTAGDEFRRIIVEKTILQIPQQKKYPKEKN